MNRRKFIRSGLLFVPFSPAIVRAVPPQLAAAVNRQQMPNASTAAPFYHATYFDVTPSYITHAGAFTGIVDSKTFTLSFWAKTVAADDQTIEIFAISAATAAKGLYVYRASNGYLYVQCFNASNTEIWNASGYTSQFLLADGWTHWFISANLATPAVGIYKNAVEHHNNSVGPTNDTINLTTSVNGYIGWLNNIKAGVRLSEVWFDTSYTATPANWRDGTKPKNLGADGSGPTGSQPIVYLPNAYSTFQTNAGSGGNYTVGAGTLIDSDSDRP